jgi:hypothetical protein
MTDGEVGNKLLGAWRYVGTRINGNNWDRGANPKGIIYYGPHGEMAVQIAPDVNRTRAGALMTPQEAFTAASPISAPTRWTKRPALLRIIGTTVCSRAIKAIWFGATI